MAIYGSYLMENVKTTNDETQVEEAVVIEAADYATEGYIFNESHEQILNEAKDPARAKLAKEAGKAIKGIFTNGGFPKCQVGGLFIGGTCAEFLKGEGNTYLYAIKYTKSSHTTGGWTGGSDTYMSSTTNDLTDELIKWINGHKKDISKAIKDKTGADVTSISVEEGRLGVINLAVTFKASSIK